ncbi:MAG: hypothetical protein R2932_07315 [Caldilineaceae bacterium]
MAIVLSPTDAWETAISTALPGNVFLLRAGLYQATDKLWLNAGTAAAPIVIKPYNCEAVRLQTSIRPNSHTVIAGLTIEAVGIADTKWAIRFDGKDRGAISDIVLRNNTILGGTIDAVRISGDVHNAYPGNHIDGGQEGHDIFVTAESAAVVPDQITITQNRLTKHYFDSSSEDMFQVRDVGFVEFTHNICTDGYDMEQCVDIKNATVPLLIAHNFFDGETLHQAGEGEDGSGGCMVIHEEDGKPEQHLIEHNFFYHCGGTVIRFAPGSKADQSSALVRYNLFVQRDAEAIMPIEAASNVLFLHNTMVNGTLKLGNSGQTRLPHNLLFQDNIFYHIHIEDNTLPPDATYVCTHNLIYQLTGSGFHVTPCTNTVEADPLFLNLAQNNFYLDPNSSAIGQATDNTDIGALPSVLSSGLLTQHTFIPLVLYAASR